MSTNNNTELETSLIKREFILIVEGQTIPLADPNPNWRTDEVLRHYIAFYPSLATATIAPPEYKNGKMVVTFQSAIGSKG